MKDQGNDPLLTGLSRSLEWFQLLSPRVGFLLRQTPLYSSIRSKNYAALFLYTPVRITQVLRCMQVHLTNVTIMTWQ